jgi:multidrug resistance efflux pump
MVATPFSRRITAEGNLEAVVSTPISPPQVAGGARVMKIAWLAPDGAEVATGDVVIRFDPTELEQQLERGQADLAAARLKLSKERIGARSAEAGRDTSATLAALELDRTARFQNKDTEIFSRNQIIESEIDSELSRARLEHAGDARSLEGRITRSKLAAIDVERRSAELQITQARAGLERLEVKAPKSGILVLKRDWRGNLPRVGEQVWPGRTIAKIPVLDQMEAEVFVLEVDGGGLSEGTPATVVVDARPGREIQAVVKRVDKLAKRRLHQLPVQYFAVTLELSETEPALMKPGQRVRATLILDKEEALMVPRQAVFEVEGAQVVYRRGQGGVFEPVEVELGAGTPGRVVVESGLTAGDQVALRDPTRREADDPAKPSGVAGEGAATP